MTTQICEIDQTDWIQLILFDPCKDEAEICASAALWLQPDWIR